MNPEAKPTPAAETRPSFPRRHGRKLLALAFWVLLLGGYQLYAWQNGLTPIEAVRVLVGFMGNGVAGALVFLAVYTVRPLVLFPASILTVGAGFVFGPILGVVLTIIGSNASATVAYLAGRYFGEGLVRSEGVVRRYTRRLRENSFETVLTMRFVFLPYDLVNYLAGLLRISWVPFILATALGSLPGTMAFVLLGATFEGDFADGAIGFDPRVLAASAIIFVLGIAASRYFKQRERRRMESPRGT